MARKNRGKQFVKNEELPAEKHSDESATSKSSESVAKTKEKSSGCGTTALFIVGLIVGLALGGLIFYAMGSNASNTGTNDAQMNASGQKAISFISKNLIRTGDTATMINISELNKTGVYKLTPISQMALN